MQKKEVIGQHILVNINDLLSSVRPTKSRLARSFVLLLLATLGTCPVMALEMERSAPLPYADHQQNPASRHDRLLDVILTWLTVDVPVPANYQHPRIEIVSPEQLAAIRLRGSDTALQARDVSDEQSLANTRDTVALYENDSRTIYLREGWTGETTSEISVLVHEMVHHLQNLAGDRFACPQEREQAAYAAQRKWLENAGLDFFAEFETDPMTLMLRTACGF